MADAKSQKEKIKILVCGAGILGSLYGARLKQSGQDVNEATIPEEDVVGRAFTVFWPFNRSRWLSVPEQYDAIPEPRS